MNCMDIVVKSANFSSDGSSKSQFFYLFIYLFIYLFLYLLVYLFFQNLRYTRPISWMLIRLFAPNVWFTQYGM